jgi:hypothetical protein
MKYLDVSDEYVKTVLAANDLERVKIDESGEAAPVVEETAEVHACPLCETQLSEPIPEENMNECIEFILGTINEAMEQEGDTLSEADDDEDADADAEGAEENEVE